MPAETWIHRLNHRISGAGHEVVRLIDIPDLFAGLIDEGQDCGDDDEPYEFKPDTGW